MSLENLPYDVFFLLLKDLKSYDLNYISTVKALRLTSTSLNLAATGALFESLHLSASHSKSWMKMEKIQQQTTLVRNVRFLVVQREIYFESDINVRLDLASMPYLEEIVIKTVSRLSVIDFKRRRLVKNPEHPEHHIHLSFNRDKENRWVKFISDLAKGALAHGFELDILIVNQDYFDQSFWIRILPKIDLRYLLTLSIRLCGEMKSTDHQLMASIILPALRSLPSLVHLIIHQCIPEDKRYIITCDLIQILHNYHWPSVQQIQIVKSPTSLASLRNFLLLYRGQLQHLALYGECPKMAIDDFWEDCVEQNMIHIDDSDDDNIDNSRRDRECGQVLQAWIEQKITPECFTIGSLETWQDIYWNIISFKWNEAIGHLCLSCFGFPSTLSGRSFETSSGLLLIMKGGGGGGRWVNSESNLSESWSSSHLFAERVKGSGERRRRRMIRRGEKLESNRLEEIRHLWFIKSSRSTASDDRRRYTSIYIWQSLAFAFSTFYSSLLSLSHLLNPNNLHALQIVYYCLSIPALGIAIQFRPVHLLCGGGGPKIFSFLSMNSFFP